MLEQPELELDPQDAVHGVVDPRRLDGPGRQPGPDGCLEARPVRRDHDHVDAGLDRLGDCRRVIRVELVDGGPVGDDEAAEPELALEQVRQQMVVAMDLARGRAGEGGHDDPCAGLDRRLVRRQVDRAEGRIVGLG